MTRSGSIFVVSTSDGATFSQQSGSRNRQRWASFLGAGSLWPNDSAAVTGKVPVSVVGGPLVRQVQVANWVPAWAMALDRVVQPTPSGTRLRRLLAVDVAGAGRSPFQHCAQQRIQCESATGSQYRWHCSPSSPNVDAASRPSSSVLSTTPWVGPDADQLQFSR